MGDSDLGWFKNPHGTWHIVRERDDEPRVLVDYARSVCGVRWPIAALSSQPPHNEPTCENCFRLTAWAKE